MIKNFKKKFKYVLLYYTRERREERYFLKIYEISKKLKKMSRREITTEYIKTKRMFEYRKYISSIFSIVIAITILINIWEKFTLFFKDMMFHVNKYDTTKSIDVTEIQEVTNLLTISVSIIMTLTLIISVLVYIKETYRIFEYLIIIEEIKNDERNKLNKVLE